MRTAMNRLTTVFCVLALSCASGEEEPAGCTRAGDAAQTVIDRYDHGASLGNVPTHLGKWPPVEVTVTVWLVDVAAVDTVARTFTIDAYINAQWIDPALRYDDLEPCQFNATLSIGQLERIWLPDVVVVHSIEMRIMASPLRNVFALLYPNGTVWLNYRARLTAPCAPSDRRYPFETVTCGVTLESWAHSLGEVRLRWGPAGGAYAIRSIALREYDIVEVKTDETRTLTTMGMWSGLRMDLVLRRRWPNHLMHFYAPTALIVLMSWLQLCLGPRPLAGRAFVAVGALFALVIFALHEGATVAQAPNIRPLDVWTCGCVLFALANVAQFCIVGWLVGRSVAHSAVGECTEMDKVLLYERCKKALCMDKVCVFLMPALFVFFNVFYWTVN